MAMQKRSYANSIYTELSAEINVTTNFKQDGAVYTRPEVVDFILDLAGYTSDKPLHRMRILEPSFGQGDFLVKIIKRLLRAWKALRSSDSTLAELSEAILAVELNADSFLQTHKRIVSLLIEEEFSSNEAASLANSWLLQDDFLISDINEKFDFVIGNPPYIRQEAVAQMVEYRSRYKTVYDRADIYIPFIERSLSLLAAGGRLGFICADRWMKNRYGKTLRGYIDANYYLKIYVDMVGTPAFYSDVSAYPAIVVIGNDKPGPTRIAQRPLIERHYLNSLAQTLTRDDSISTKNNTVFEIENVTNGTEPWLLCIPDQVQLLRKLEEKFPLLEDVGCRVGIGVATGADKAFIGDYDLLDVEDSRKIPLVTTKDILVGEVRWTGKGVINPFEDDGRLVSLSNYPKLQSYLESKQTIIAARHCAQKNPTNWYRTIDRIFPVLTSTPKLLIPDIKGEPHIVYEEGRLYPHHNLYYIISENWDLRALQAVLLSSLVKLFIMNYSTKMRGDYLRFQAQYLRRICIPTWDSVPDSLRKELISAATSRNISACNQAVYGLFGLNEDEQKIVKEAVSNGT